MNLYENRTNNFARNPNMSISGQLDHPSRSCGHIYQEENENWWFRWREDGRERKSFPPLFLILAERYIQF